MLAKCKRKTRRKRKRKKGHTEEREQQTGEGDHQEGKRREDQEGPVGTPGTESGT